MTVASIGSLTLLQQKFDASSALIDASGTVSSRGRALTLASTDPTRAAPTAAAPTAAVPTAAVPTAEQRKVARDFEAIFMRQLLGSMEKAGGFGGESNSSGAMYRSMMVGALADTAAEGGGIGLAELILKAMLPAVAPVTPTATVPNAPAASSKGKGSALEGVSQRNSR